MSIEAERVAAHVKRVRELCESLRNSGPSSGLGWYENVGALIVMADALAGSASRLAETTDHKEGNKS